MRDSHQPAVPVVQRYTQKLARVGCASKPGVPQCLETDSATKSEGTSNFVCLYDEEAVCGGLLWVEAFLKQQGLL